MTPPLSQPKDGNSVSAFKQQNPEVPGQMLPSEQGPEPNKALDQEQTQEGLERELHTTVNDTCNVGDVDNKPGIPPTNKKPRGRPPKISHQPDSKPNDKDAAADDDDDNHAPGLTTAPSAHTPAKKRGRPPKVKAQPDEDQPHHDDQAPASPLNDDSQIPKKRGRPPKSIEKLNLIAKADASRSISQRTRRPSKPSSSAINRETESESDESNDDDDDSEDDAMQMVLEKPQGPGIKRRRGRPSKVKVPLSEDHVQNDDQLAASSLNGAGQTPKKRGRPAKAKVPLPNSQGQESLIKGSVQSPRKRGRPPKVKVDPDMTTDMEDHAGAVASSLLRHPFFESSEAVAHSMTLNIGVITAKTLAGTRTGLKHASDYSFQMKMILEKLDVLLQNAGSTKHHLLSVRIYYLVKPGAWESIASEWNDYAPSNALPAVSVLPLGAAFEGGGVVGLEATAEVALAPCN